MTSKRIAILLVLLSASMSVCGQTSAAYPPQRGAVSDYAGKLSEAQVQELTGLIQRYKQKTSIEFAVVVVDSLHGRAVKEYAIGLGDSWGVGKAGRSNGVVLLWAPNERAYSLRIADGLTAELSDSDAKLITQQHLLPYFKRGDYYGGLKETVQTTMAYLGDETWDERIQSRAKVADQERQVHARSQAAEQERQVQPQRGQDPSLDTNQQAADVGRFTVGFLLCLGAIVLGGFLLHARRQRQKKLAELAQANDAIAASLSRAEENAPQIQRLLDDFSKEAPEQDLTALRSNLAGQAERITKIRLDATLLDPTKLESYDEMVRIKTNAETESRLLDSVQGRIGDIRNAKQQSQALMGQLSKENFQISDLRDSSRRGEIDQLLLQSRQGYEQARQNSSMSVFDWLIINDLLSRSHSQVQQAVQYSQEDPYVPSAGDSGDSTGSGFLDSTFSGGSDSSSSFSGGGGGFSGGSGSDGSY